MRDVFLVLAGGAGGWLLACWVLSAIDPRQSGRLELPDPKKEGRRR